jgi:UDP-glucose 4-epimerase
MASRGSVIPLFLEQIINREQITVTDPNMTRFMMTLDDAVDLVIYAFTNGKSGEIFVQKAPAATIDTLVNALKNICETGDIDVKVIGTRHGEKLYETLLSREEMVAANDRGDYFCVPPDLRDLNYSKYIESGTREISDSDDYNSHNTAQLNVKSMSSILMKLPMIRSLSKRSSADEEK